MSNQNSTQNAENTNPETHAQGDALNGIVDSLVGLGAVWAQHGIEVGRLALKTQSTWLRSLSGLLGQVADAMEPLTRVHPSTSPNSTDANGAG